MLYLILPYSWFWSDEYYCCIDANDIVFKLKYKLGCKNFILLESVWVNESCYFFIFLFYILSVLTEKNCIWNPIDSGSVPHAYFLHFVWSKLTMEIMFQNLRASGKGKFNIEKLIVKYIEEVLLKNINILQFW